MTVIRSLFSLVIFTCGVALGMSSFGTTVYAGADAHAFEILYGEGVNAFNNKDYEKTVQLFDEAESQGNFDPRCYFFRGLAKYRLGLAEDATQDFEYAASLELSKAGRGYNVPRSLQRIQGQERLLLEQYRRQAKKKWENEQALLKKTEFEVQKQKDRLLYNQLIEQGANAEVEVDAATGVQPLSRQIPFGARAIIPFGVTNIKSTEMPSEVPVMTDDNMFKDELEKTVVLPPTRKRTRTISIPEDRRPGARRRLAAEREAMLEDGEFDEEGWDEIDGQGNLFGDGPGLFGNDDDDADPDLFGDDDDGDDIDQSEDALEDPFAESSMADEKNSDQVIPLPDTLTEESGSAEKDSDDPFAEDATNEEASVDQEEDSEDDPFDM